MFSLCCSYSEILHLFFAMDIYSFAISMPIDFRLYSIATKQDVPVPTNGSNTIPFFGQVNIIGVRHKSAGYGAKWTVLPCVSSGPAQAGS